MKTIKIIELLNKIANGEDVPKKIKYNGDLLKLNEDVQDYIGISETGSGSLFNYLFVNKATNNFINDKIEIIEDDENKIEKLSYFENNTGYVIKKINELVDKVNMIEDNMNHIPRID